MDGPSPVTARAVAIGLFLGVGFNLIMLYNDYYLGNTLLSLNHFPSIGIALLLFMAGANVFLRRWPGAAFTAGEMLLIYCVVALSVGIGATGFARCIIGFMASPAYFATPSNDYVQYLVAHMPEWAVVSNDPDSTALKWYFEGLPRGQRIPWEEWVVPLAAWIGFFVASYCVMYAFTSLLYRQWADRERLTFPLIYVPIELARAPGQGRLVNDFLRSRAMWIGAAIPILVFAVNGIRNYFPAVPLVPLNFGTWGFFADRPWSEFNLGWAHLYFAIIGLTFLLTTEVSFSLWFFFVLYRLSYVYVAWLGAAGTGYFSAWNSNIATLQCAGGILIFGAFLLWNARVSLAGWWRRLKAGEDDPQQDLMPPKLTLVLLAAGFAGLVLFVIAHGAQWWAALLGMVLFVSVIIFLTRLVAEAGMFLVGVEAIGYEFLNGVFPARWLSAGTVATYVQLRGGVMSDLRELVMPYLMNGIRMCAHAGTHARKVLLVFTVTIAIALVACCYGRISTCYKYGAAQGDLAYNGGWQWLYGDTVKRLKSPEPLKWVTAGSTNVLPVGVAHVLTGAAATVGLLVMRARFLWWPLNPIGYLVCGSWPITEIWFGVMIGWACKAAVMTFGGAVVYRKVLPFFLGLALGEAMIGTFWTVVSFITGQAGVYTTIH